MTKPGAKPLPQMTAIMFVFAGARRIWGGGACFVRNMISAYGFDAPRGEPRRVGRVSQAGRVWSSSKETNTSLRITCSVNFRRQMEYILRAEIETITVGGGCSARETFATRPVIGNIRTMARRTKRSDRRKRRAEINKLHAERYREGVRIFFLLDDTGAES